MGAPGHTATSPSATSTAVPSTLTLTNRITPSSPFPSVTREAQAARSSPRSLWVPLPALRVSEAQNTDRHSPNFAYFANSREERQLLFTAASPKGLAHGRRSTDTVERVNELRTRLCPGLPFPRAGQGRERQGRGRPGAGSVSGPCQTWHLERSPGPRPAGYLPGSGKLPIPPGLPGQRSAATSPAAGPTAHARSSLGPAQAVSGGRSGQSRQGNMPHRPN